MVDLGDIKDAVHANGFESDQDTRIVVFANEVQRDVVNDFRWRFMTETDTVSAVVGVDSYALPTSPPMAHVISIRLAVPGQPYWPELEWADTEDLLAEAAEYGDLSVYSTPQRWTDLDGETFQVFPGPTMPGTFTIRYLRTVEDLVDDADVPEIPSQYLDIIVAGVCARLARRERRLQDAADFYATYTARLERMRSQYEIRQNQTSRHVKQTGRYTDPYC